jgi:hypothetical protein
MDRKLVLGHVNGKGIQSKNLNLYARVFTIRLERRATVAEIQGITPKITPVYR